MATIDLARIGAVVFDADGVITDTARVHAAAWKRTFDVFLRGRSTPFDIRADYLRHIDGRGRPDGVRAFLASRGVALPQGGPDDLPGAPSVRGLDLAEAALFAEEIGRHGVAAFPSAVALLTQLRHRGARTAAVSTGSHCRMVITAAGLTHLFDVLIDGADADGADADGADADGADADSADADGADVDRADADGADADGAAAGAPTGLLLAAARRLGSPPGRIAVVEDAVPGVTAGRAGRFGLVVGIGHGNLAAALREAGADVVVADLAELAVRGRVPLEPR
jgi:beta-phosphoglucomutase-like phosphatase (HAD superfamily)